MIKSAITISLVPEIKTGPWIFWEDLEEGMKKASALGFDGIELFTSSGKAVDTAKLGELLGKYKLGLAAIGTGAGKVAHGLTLTDPDEHKRNEAIAYIREMMAFGAAFGAPAIIGSMQGSIAQGVDHKASIATLGTALKKLNTYAIELGVALIYEPLNRYETNLINTLEHASNFIREFELTHVKLLADLFHMNIEEADLCKSIKENISHIGHVHFADSNRKPVGFGHTPMQEIADALNESAYQGYVSAEAFPWPDPDQAAAQTINSFKKYFR